MWSYFQFTYSNLKSQSLNDAFTFSINSYVQRLPESGDTVRATNFKKGFGGKGANQCVAAAKLGSKTQLISRVILFFSLEGCFVCTLMNEILSYIYVAWGR